MSLRLKGTIWHYRFSYKGRRYEGTTGETNKSRARTVESDEFSKAKEGRLNPLFRKAPTLSAAAKQFLAEIEKEHEAGNKAANTVRHYRNAWDAWLEGTELAGMRVDRIRASHINALSFPGGKFTAKNARQALGHILNWCAEKGWILAAPRIKSTRTTGRKLRYTDEQKAAMLAEMDPDCADIFTIMQDCLMRTGEVMRMRWTNVENDQARIFIPEGKTAAARRYVPMSDRVAAVLKARKDSAKRESEWVFPSRVKAKGHRVTVAKQFRAAREAAGVSADYKLYGMRHTAASELSELGVDLLTMRTLLGHEDISTTNLYLHGDIKGVADVVNERNNRRGMRIEKRA